jgi:hypothetical protein
MTDRIVLPNFNTDRFPESYREQRRVFMRTTYDDFRAQGLSIADAAFGAGYALAMSDVHASADFTNALADAAGVAH